MIVFIVGNSYLISSNSNDSGKFFKRNKFLIDYNGGRGETVIMEACGVKSKFIAQIASVGGSIPPGCPFYSQSIQEAKAQQSADCIHCWTKI